MTEKDIVDFLNQEMVSQQRSRTPLNAKNTLESKRKSNEKPFDSEI